MFNRLSVPKTAVLALLLGMLTLFAFPATAALAQEENPGERIDVRIEAYFQRLLKASDGMQTRLDKAGEIVTQANTWISTLQERGIDTTELETGLAAYQTALADVEARFAEANQLLEDHAGFDENGQVIDRPAAIETVRQAGRQLRDAHRDLRDATIDFRRLVADFRRELRELNQ